jgi:ketosteroid isomerase-like protein
MQAPGILLCLITLLLSLPASATTCATSFYSALVQQLDALDNRDLEAYMGVIPARTDQLMILPDGSTWTSREEIKRNHKEWFEDKSWIFNKELVRKDVREHWGLAVYRVTVDRPDKPGTPFLLSMVFAPEQDGCWYLQHDQNTALPN